METDQSITVRNYSKQLARLKDVSEKKITFSRSGGGLVIQLHENAHHASGLIELSLIHSHRRHHHQWGERE